MKIGILTFWYTNENYGQLLQAYALSTYLKENGHEVFLVKYDKNKAIKAENKGLLKKLQNLSYAKLLKALNKKLAPKKKISLPDRQFNKFRNDFLSFSDRAYNTLNELNQHPPEADMYIVGSDQVWNYVFIGAYEPFFLQFGSDSTKRVAYAASIGHRTLPDDVADKYKTFLKSFDLIGVRETSGVELVKAMGFNQAKLMPDPTFLLSPKSWQPLIDKASLKREAGHRNVFVYTLGNRPLEAKDQVLEYVRSLEKTSVNHASINNDNSGNFYPTIPEWLAHIATSDLIVTNSFHGVVFSIKFNRKFIALPSKGATVGMNERMESLLGKLKLDQHLMYSHDPLKIDKILNEDKDWSETNKILTDWIGEAKEFLSFK